MKTIVSLTFIGFTFFAFGLSSAAFCQSNAENQMYAMVENTPTLHGATIVPVSKAFTPKLSMVQDNLLMHILNPEMASLTFQVKDGNGQEVEGWISENFETNDAKQALNFGGLKPGIYWVEISSPESQSVWFKWQRK